MKRIAFFLLFVLLLPQIAYSEAHAQMDDCKFKITIHTAFTGAGASEAFANRVENAVSNYWNKGLKVGECSCEFEVEVKTKIVSDCKEAESSDPEYHCITVYNTKGVHRAWVYRSDFTRGLSQTVAGNMAGPGQLEVHDSDATLAHEFGHLMGLRDEYADHYMYYMYDDNKNKFVSGPTFITPGEFTEKKKQEIEGKLQEGQKIVFQKNKYGKWLFSVPRKGIPPNSLMAVIGPNSKVCQHHVDAIFTQSRLTCPEECCCGNGKLDSSKDEECDPKTSPTGCDEYYKCTSECKCEKDYECGDGEISGPEECDYEADPTGCSSSEECTTECECVPISGVSDEPMEDFLMVEIINPPPGGTVIAIEPVMVEYSDPGAVMLVEYFVDGELFCQEQDPFFLCEIIPELYGDGEHELTVTAYGEDSAEASDEVEFFIEGYPE
ncbi:MAG: Ig-like domain-containing protein [Candidatus Micrarchaeia archaeon]